MTYYAFKVNEYVYRRLYFTAHRTRKGAEKKHAVDFRIGEMPVSQDTWTQICEEKAGLEAWAKECQYIIDWKNKVLIYQEPKNENRKPR